MNIKIKKNAEPDIACLVFNYWMNLVLPSRNKSVLDLNNKQVLMIFHKIFILEQELQTHLKEGRKKQKALNNIKQLLNQVNSNAEVVPAKDLRRLSLMLSCLKGKRLSRYENLVLKEIIDA